MLIIILQLKIDKLKLIIQSYIVENEHDLKIINKTELVILNILLMNFKII